MTCEIEPSRMACSASSAQVASAWSGHLLIRLTRLVTDRGASIDSFVVAHPRPTELGAVFRKLGVETPVVGSDRHSVNLVLNGPRGKVWLS